MTGRSFPARCPSGAVWPLEMRADLVAAYLDYRTTGELFKAVAAGDAPRPTAWRGTGAARVRVWSRAAIDAHLARRHGLAHADDPSLPEDISRLI